MNHTVLFRDFEERDIDFIYRCKNDEKLNSQIVGEYRPFTYEEATKWVYGCMGEHESYKFWAVCTNDSDKRIVGWVSLADIDKTNKSACFHGVVIADKDYQDGFAWIESYLFIYHYVFEVLNFNRIYGSRLVEHKQTNTLGYVLFSYREGILRQAVWKDGRFHDLVIGSVLSSEYFEHKEKGDYEMRAILKRIKDLKNKSSNC